MPKLNTYRKYNYTCEVWNYTLSSSATNAVPTYFLLGTKRLDVTQGVLGKLTLIFPDDADDIMQKAQIQKVVDKDGKELFPGGVWTLGGLQPIVNNFGQREGFRSTANLTFTTMAV